MHFQNWFEQNDMLVALKQRPKHLIELKIAILTLANGLNHQKKLKENIAAFTSSILKYKLYYRRNEENIRISNEQKELNNDINRGK